jgi:hypothetical protein
VPPFRACLTGLLLALAPELSAQDSAQPARDDVPPPTVEDERVSTPDPGPADGQVSPATSSGEEPSDRPPPGYLPRLDVFFPEGDLDLRVNRLINKVFFEGQVKYNVVEGDITAFLRYRYYGYRRTLQVTAFDAVEFDGIEELSDDFSRVRGILGIVQWPHDYHHRTFLLGEIDRLISNKSELRFTNNRTNTFIRLGYQVGTPQDGRSNSLVGESRARVERLFTPFREIGPNASGLTVAATYGFDIGLGDFEYVKLELEALKRFSLSQRNLLVGRLHIGGFPIKDRCSEGDPGTPCQVEEDLPIEDRFSIPRSELFRLDGRENLKGLTDRLRGTYEIHTTWEFFFPWFLDRKIRALGLEWNNWYWVLYSGLGTTGFDDRVFFEGNDYVPDVGFGFESSFRLRKYSFFLSGVVAQALNGQGEPEARLSIKSYH